MSSWDEYVTAVSCNGHSRPSPEYGQESSELIEGVLVDSGDSFDIPSILAEELGYYVEEVPMSIDMASCY